MRLNEGADRDVDLALPWLMGITQLLNWGAFYYSLPAFVAPISANLGWSRELIFAGLSAALLTAVVAAPLVGREMDRGRGRRVMLAGQVLGTVSMAALAAIHSVPQFLTICCVLGVSQAATFYDAAFSLLHRQLGPRAPAAIIRVTLIAGFAGTVFVPASQYCVDHFGWRMAALLMSLAGILAFILTAIGIRPKTADVEGRADNAAEPSSPMLEPTQWKASMMAALVAFAASTAVFSTVTIHFLPLLIDRGLRGFTAAQYFALVGPAQIAARLLLFLAPPATPAIRFGIWVFVLQSLGVTLLILAHDGLLLLVFALVFGASSGLLTIVRGLAPAEICSRGMIGRLNGAIGAVGGVGRAIMPAAFAVGVSHWGSSATLALLLVVALLGTASFIAIGALERSRSAGHRSAA